MPCVPPRKMLALFVEFHHRHCPWKKSNKPGYLLGGTQANSQENMSAAKPKEIPCKINQPPVIREKCPEQGVVKSDDDDDDDDHYCPWFLLHGWFVWVSVCFNSYYSICSCHFIYSVIHSFIYWHIDWLVADDDSLMFVALAALRPTSLPTVIPTAGSTWWWEVNLWSFVTRIFFTDVLTKGCYNTPLEHTPSNL